MKLTKNSQFLMSFFLNNNCVQQNKPTKETKEILTTLYNDILEAFHALKREKKGGWDISIKKIESIKQITKPTSFNYNIFPEEVRKHIDTMSLSEVSVSFSLFHRKIKLFFITEESIDILKMEEYTKYIDAVVLWLLIATKYSTRDCSKSLSVYFYFTSLSKKVPESNIHVLNENNVNTAFTRTCTQNSEIIIFRKEEWFKVFMHETFHNFALDFSDMNNEECHQRILSIFSVYSEVNLYESYTEFWAEIMNACFCSFFSLKDKNNKEEFLEKTILFIEIERNYSFFQLVKTLNFMGLSYKDLYSKQTKSVMLRNTFYKEKTNVLAYYVIKLVLINQYQHFLHFCKENNSSLLEFKKTVENQRKLCIFIEKNYKLPSVLKGVDCATQILQKLDKTPRKTKNTRFLLHNLRMTICELG